MLPPATIRNTTKSSIRSGRLFTRFSRNNYFPQITLIYADLFFCAYLRNLRETYMKLYWKQARTGEGFVQIIYQSFNRIALQLEYTSSNSSFAVFIFSPVFLATESISSRLGFPLPFIVVV